MKRRDLGVRTESEDGDCRSDESTCESEKCEGSEDEEREAPICAYMSWTTGNSCEGLTGTRWLEGKQEQQKWLRKSMQIPPSEKWGY